MWKQPDFPEGAPVGAAATPQPPTANASNGLTCIACRLTFDSVETQRAHYKEDWHRFNLKRKVAGLPPVDQAAFESRVAQLAAAAAPRNTLSAPWRSCDVCKKSFNSEGASRSHMKSNMHKRNVARAAQQAATGTGPAPTGGVTAPMSEATHVTSDTTTSTSTSASSDSTGSPVPMDTAPTAAAEKRTIVVTERLQELRDAVAANPEDFSELEKEKIAAAEMFPVTDCLFCGRHHRSLEACLRHMSAVHSFWIPDIEYCTDIPGLVEYLGEKLAVGNICLWCNGKGKAFASLEAVRSHSRAQVHCRILYDGNEAEYMDFFDYTERLVEEITPEEEAALAAAGGEGGEEDWEDVDDDGEDDDEDDPDRIIELADGRKVRRKKASVVGVSEDGLGELVLANGTRLGNRVNAVYYRQRYTQTESKRTQLIRRLLADYKHRGQVAKYSGGVFVSVDGKGKSAEVPARLQFLAAKQSLRKDIKNNKLHVVRPQVLYAG